LVAILYYILPGKTRWAWLLLASLFFYMFAAPLNILVPVSIILTAYGSGILIEKASTPKKANLFFILGIIIIVGILIAFKYLNFFTDILFDLANIVRHKFLHSPESLTNSLFVKIITPLGISYITFQAMGYLIEIKQGNHKAERNLGHFSAYLLYFPKLIAGPVERAHNFLPQLKKPIAFDFDTMAQGLKLILWGLFKKVVIADNLGSYINDMYGNLHNYQGISLIAGCFLYTLQMYTDFSGYTDMAIGLSRLLGINLMQNFDRPFTAKSLTEFWRRWHISLSTWFGDYFYKPIAIKRRNWGNWSIVYASMVTFIVLGFWHGANWTYIVFGGIHGFMLALEFFTKKIRKNIRSKIPVFINDYLGILFTISYFTFSLVFFRASSLSDAFYVIKHAITGLPEDIYNLIHQTNYSLTMQTLYYLKAFLIYGSLVFIIQYFRGKINDPLLVHRYSKLAMVSFYVLLLFIVLVWGNFGSRDFIYAQF
jgi:D-alanyl-lipoteichoic acid acyltransferase DltB (MBOAT superfamily)